MAKFTVLTTVPNEEAILGDSSKGIGIRGTSVGEHGGSFHSEQKEGVWGQSNSPATAAIAGVQQNVTGTGAGLFGESKGTGAAIVGINNAKGAGAFFHGEVKEGLIAETKSPDNAAIAAFQKNPSSGNFALYAEHSGNLTAAFFKGNVIVTGDVSFPGADCAEEFTVKDDSTAEPGTLMALSDGGELIPSTEAYERRVAGVIAGAGSHRPGIIMDRQPGVIERRHPIALVGKVFCKVDASYGPIEAGDLLTSSQTPGHAMKASDPTRAFGAVIGKAMSSYVGGKGLIPILVSLQ